MNISLGAIAISVLIGIGSNLLTPYVGKLLGRAFAPVRKRNDERKKNIEKAVKFVMKNPQEEVILRIRYVHRHLISILVTITALFLMISSNPFQVLFGFIVFIISNFSTTRANRLGKILEEVGKRKRTKFKEVN